MKGDEIWRMNHSLDDELDEYARPTGRKYYSTKVEKHPMWRMDADGTLTEYSERLFVHNGPEGMVTKMNEETIIIYFRLPEEQNTHPQESEVSAWYKYTFTRYRPDGAFFEVFADYYR